MRQSTFVSLALGSVALLFVASTASAHALGAECKIQGESVILEAYFSDNTPAQDATVHVYDDTRLEIAKGKTDSAGKWSFPVPSAGRYEVVVDAGMGHRAEVPLVVESFKSTGTAADLSQRVLNTGPSRKEFTRLPWEQVFIGLAAIGLCAVALRWWLRWRAHSLDQASSVTQPSLSNREPDSHANRPDLPLAKNQ